MAAAEMPAKGASVGSGFATGGRRFASSRLNWPHGAHRAAGRSELLPHESHRHELFSQLSALLPPNEYRTRYARGQKSIATALLANPYNRCAILTTGAIAR